MFFNKFLTKIIWPIQFFFVPLHHQIIKKKNMWFGIFICVCAAIMVVDAINDPEFREKIKNVEE